jgi:hypothetical protein
MFTRCLNYLRKLVRSRDNDNITNLINNKKRIRLKALDMTNKKKLNFLQNIRKIMELRGSSNVSSDDIKNQEEKSPHERFRGSKNLSVTDFSSLAWCELQQHYFFIAGGRKETLAMKIGSEIHNKLELQVHDLVTIPTYTKEDIWGIK